MASNTMVALPRSVEVRYLSKNDYDVFLSSLREKTFPDGYTCPVNKNFCNCVSIDYLRFATSIFIDLSIKYINFYKPQESFELDEMQCKLTKNRYAAYPSRIVNPSNMGNLGFLENVLKSAGPLVNQTENYIYELYVIFCSKLENMCFGDDIIKETILCFFYELFSFDSHCRKNSFTKRLMNMKKDFANINPSISDTQYMEEARQIFVKEAININKNGVEDNAYKCFLNILMASFDETEDNKKTLRWIIFHLRSFFAVETKKRKKFI